MIFPNTGVCSLFLWHVKHLLHFQMGLFVVSSWTLVFSSSSYIFKMDACVFKLGPCVFKLDSCVFKFDLCLQDGQLCFQVGLFMFSRWTLAHFRHISLPQLAVQQPHNPWFTHMFFHSKVLPDSPDEGQSEPVIVHLPCHPVAVHPVAFMFPQ